MLVEVFLGPFLTHGSKFIQLDVLVEFDYRRSICTTPLFL